MFRKQKKVGDMSRSTSLTTYKKMFLMRCVATNEVFAILADTEAELENYEHFRFVLYIFICINIQGDI